MTTTPETEPFTDVCVDLDGVIYPFATAFHRYCETVHYKQQLEKPFIYDFYKQWGMTSAEFVKLLPIAVVSHNLFGTEAPMEGAAEGWKLLQDAGVQIHVVTSRPTAAWKQTIDWLETNHLIPAGLHFTNRKTIITRLATGRCAAIDDYVAHFDDLTDAGVHTVLRTHTWNAEHPTEMRVNSFKEFAQFIFDTNQTITNEQATAQKTVAK